MRDHGECRRSSPLFTAGQRFTHVTIVSFRCRNPSPVQSDASRDNSPVSETRAPCNPASPHIKQKYLDMKSHHEVHLSPSSLTAVGAVACGRDSPPTSRCGIPGQHAIDRG